MPSRRRRASRFQGALTLTFPATTRCLRERPRRARIHIAPRQLEITPDSIFRDESSRVRDGNKGDAKEDEEERAEGGGGGGGGGGVLIKWMVIREV